METLLKRQNFDRGLSRFYLAIALLIAAFTSAGCRSEITPAHNNTPGREFTDDLGRTVKVPSGIDRVISLAPNLTENIFAVGAGEKLVGVTSFCDYPEEAKKIAKVGDTLNPSLETIIALKPQIVFVSTASQMENLTKTLERQNISVFVQDPKNLDDVLRNLKQLGDIFGTEEKTGKLIDGLSARIKTTQEKVKDLPKPLVFVQIDKESLYTIGQESFMTDLLVRAGAKSATGDLTTAYPKISKETALALDPEMIVLSESPNNLEPSDVFKNSRAVKTGRVFKINADLLSRPSPRIVDGLEQLTKDLHPEK